MAGGGNEGRYGPAANRPLFTFAILSDTHVRPPGGDNSSPYAVNLKANGRARHAVALIGAARPVLTVHLGDMVHPMPSLPTFGPAAEEARRILAPLMPRLHFVAGNHDVGDKPLAGLPAEAATPGSLALAEHHFGSTFGAFEHAGCRFLRINSSLMNTGLDAEAEQWLWLESELSRAPAPRTFAFIHYPPFITSADEPSHYDNIDEPARGRLLALLAGAGVEAVFSGHVHHFFYNRHRGMRLYVLPPTSFIRQDYAELFPVPPTPEFGRDDVEKYAVTLVDVFSDGHRLRVVPTGGVELAEGASVATAPDAETPRGASLTVHARHAWARAIDLPYNGPMEEASRKRARNDLLLARLWQMGISTLRTPLADLLDPETAARMEDFHAVGIGFSLFALGAPDAAGMTAIGRHRHLVRGVEMLMSRAMLPRLGEAIGMLAPLDGIETFVGRLASSADDHTHGKVFAHAVSYGFTWEERDDAIGALRAADPNGRITGLAFQIDLTDDVAPRLAALDALGRKTGLVFIANVRLADSNPARPNFDDAAILVRVREAVRAARTLSHVRVQLDTLVDVDRGYHPRHGLVDRQSNLRPAGRWLAGLPTAAAT